VNGYGCLGAVSYPSHKHFHSLLELYRAMKMPSGKANLAVYNYLVVVIN